MMYRLYSIDRDIPRYITWMNDDNVNKDFVEKLIIGELSGASRIINTVWFIKIDKPFIDSSIGSLNNYIIQVHIDISGCKYSPQWICTFLLENS